MAVPALCATGVVVQSRLSTPPGGTMIEPSKFSTAVTCTVAWPTGGSSVPTFAGNAGTVPAQAFTGASFDNRSAYMKVIFCQFT